MMQKLFEAGTEVVESRFSVGRYEETVFGTTTATGKMDIAPTATAGERGFFRGAEGELLV